MSTLRISDAPLLPDVDGTEKIPTGGAYDAAHQVTGYGKVVDFYKSDSDYWIIV